MCKFERALTSEISGVIRVPQSAHFGLEHKSVHFGHFTLGTCFLQSFGVMGLKKIFCTGLYIIPTEKMIRMSD